LEPNKDSQEIDDVLSNPETFGREEESNQSGSTYSKHSLQLNELLDQAVSHEDYEKAAKIRDEISKDNF
jgi:protein-arginine kinase activator protein McsA